MLLKDFVDHQNVVVIQSDGYGMLSDMGNLQQMGMLLETQDWHHIQPALGHAFILHHLHLSWLQE